MACAFRYGYQQNCNRQGFNIQGQTAYTGVNNNRDARIGIYFNGENDCSSPDSGRLVGATSVSAVAGCSHSCTGGSTGSGRSDFWCASRCSLCSCRHRLLFRRLGLLSAGPRAESPPPPPPMPPWAIVSGGQWCSITSNGQCVTDGTGSHGNNERCTIRAQQSLYATATYFDTESYYDYITIGGGRWSGSTGPANIAMWAGATMTWYTDHSVTNGGFVICATHPPPPSPNLFFSQYQEGSGNNKFLQIYNPTGATIALSGYAFPERHECSDYSRHSRALEHLHRRRDDCGRRLLHDLPPIGRGRHPVIV